MRSIRILTLLLLVLTLAISLAACTPTPVPDTPDADDKAITGITFPDLTVDYDGNEHTVTVVGALPEGVSVSYSGNSATDAGAYSATATLSGEGYKTLTLTATLTINKLNFEDLTLSGITSDYDGAYHSISVLGELPTGTTVTYTGGEDGQNGATNAGSYTVKACLTNKNYNDLTLTSSIVINKIALGGIAFDDLTVDYDGKVHRVTVSGILPVGSTVTYTGGEDGTNGSTAPGVYEVTVTITGRNYLDYTDTATLKIESEEKALSLVVIDGKIYFQNALDRDYLYVIDGNEITRVGYDYVSDLIDVDGTVFLNSNALFGASISYINSEGKVTAVAEASAASVTTDGTYLYYAVNKLLGGDENGIYKVAVADLTNSSVDAAPTKLSSVKADWLNYAEGMIYFSNESDGGKLYAVSVGGGTERLIYGYKVSEMITDGESLYFTRSNLLAAAIYGIDVTGGLNTEVTDGSARVVKITTSNGKYLNKVGDYIYFINTDMLTATLFGDGIYRAKADGSTWVEDVASLMDSGAKVIAFENDRIFSLASDGTNLYYYRTLTRHLYEYSLSLNEETDLMEGFEPPVYEEAILTAHSKTAHYDGYIYFINMLDGGRLYRYNIVTGSEERITASEVADFALNDGYLYYTTVKLVVNLDLYRLNAVTGETVQLSTDNCLNYVFIGDKVYFTNDTDKTLEVLDLTTLSIEVAFSDEDVNPYRMQYYGEKLYFVAGDLLYALNIDDGTAKEVNSGLKPLDFIIYDDKILLMNCAGFTNHVSLYDMNTDKITDLDGLGISGFSSDCRGMFVWNDTLFFYRNIAAGTDTEYGLYKVVVNNGKYTQELVSKLEGYYLCESTLIGDTLYFLDVWRVKDTIPTTASDAHLYSLDLTTLGEDEPTVTQLN